MEEIYKSKYVKHIYHSEKEILEVIWTEGGLMSNDEYRQESLNFVETAKKYKAKGSLIDTRDFQYIISPEIQEWLNATVFPQVIEAGVQKMAFLVTKELFAQVSIEQTMEEDTAIKGFQTQFFAERDNAINWL